MKSKKSESREDIFANIAAKQQMTDEMRLITPVPLKLPDIVLPTTKSTKAAFKPKPKISTAAQLQRELVRYRKKYAKFMQDLAPDIKDTRKRLSLRQFNWRVERSSDKKDFSRVLQGKDKWEKVEIPHYGPPLGRAVTYYRTTFKLNNAMFAEDALFICFKGVDYKAHVFMNGSYLGSHEGFFAPFEFEFTNAAKPGENTLVVKVENDAICLGNYCWGKDGARFEGDKLYAATGPGYDEPEVGWHHCPPGMGIYQDVFIEARSAVHIKDIFVRPMLQEKKAEAWVEVFSCVMERVENLALQVSLFGQNFKATVFKQRKFEIDYAGPTINLYRISFNIQNPRKWELESPWLYQIQIKLLDENKVLDIVKTHFGMRSFKMDVESKPKGKLCFNNRPIRLRGANTMGHLQQCVIKKDFDQLRDDILLAKICHLNYLRLTQRPVQREVYDYCDKLGLMTQTDLPLFGELRRNQFAEAIRQTEEMERLVRCHPCNIMVTYINEPFPNGHNKPHRHLNTPELKEFYAAADKAVLLVNPDRVIKPVDGDYDPPSPGLPDNHCYCGWYNGHGVELGKLHRGYWQKVKPGWHYACGEFGSEGLDYAEVMRTYYPSKWLPESTYDEKTWSPVSITAAQTGKFHYMWFNTQHSLEDWAAASQEHQRWITQMMTEAFRRDSRMNSFAIHLLIDAFPSGWMKAIMDFKRQPKPAYFTYRNTLEPLLVNLRTDRYKFFCDEEINLEAWVCNDLKESPKNSYLHYQFEVDKKIIYTGHQKASVPVCESKFQGFLRFVAPEVDRRTQATLRLGLLDDRRRVINDAAITIDLFPKPVQNENRTVLVIGSRQGKAAALAKELGLKPVFSGKTSNHCCILIDDYELYEKRSQEICNAVKKGTVAVFIELPVGNYKIAGSPLQVRSCGMSGIEGCAQTGLHFASPNTNHEIIKGFKPDDFRFWYNSQTDYVTPILDTGFWGDDFDEILTSGVDKGEGQWGKILVAAEKKHRKGAFRICQTSLAGKTNNPVAHIFAGRLLGLM